MLIDQERFRRDLSLVISVYFMRFFILRWKEFRASFKITLRIYGNGR